MRTPYHILPAAALFALGVAQAQSVDQWTAWGDAAMAREEYYGASHFYGGALAIEPGRMGLQWKQAEACRLSNQYPQAMDLYEKVYRKDAGRSHPEALKWLGEMQLCDGRYEEARTTWNKVLQKARGTDAGTASRARNALAGCDLANSTPPDTFEVVHLPGPINTTDSEFGARNGPQESLWFTSLRGALTDDGEVKDTADYRVSIYSTRPSPAGWDAPLPELATTPGAGPSQANLMWTPEGDRAYFTRIDGDGTKHLVVRSPGKGTRELAGLEGHANATQPWVTSMGARHIIFFACAGGEGGTDIWHGVLDGDVVTDIRNAGPLVNSPGNEGCPSFDAASGTLWFSSDHHAGLGGYDIFRSALEDGEFGAPENMLAWNSSANDLYPVHDALTGKGWLTSNRKGSFAAKGETCCNDIYQVRGRPMRTVVNSVATDTMVMAGADGARPPDLPGLAEVEFPLKLYFHNDEPEPRTRLTTTRQSYGTTFEAYRKLFGRYRTENADTAAINAFLIDEAERGRAMLDSLVQALVPALDAGERITLDVRGHASPLALNEYNKDLSLRRIESLRNHLRDADGGRSRSYMDSTATNGGILRLRVLPFGEERTAAGVSDDRNDLERSVYSVQAARERRVEIEHAWREGPVIRASEKGQVLAIGTVRQGVPQEFQVEVFNDGDAPLHLVRGTSSCDCILVTTLPQVLPPGSRGVLGLQYSGRARPGPLERLVDLAIEGRSMPYTLTVRGLVIE